MESVTSSWGDRKPYVVRIDTTQ